jgi:hypothetical protein
MNYREWKQSVVVALQPFTSLAYQRRVWTGLALKDGQMGSYDESVETLLSSAQFDRFVEEFERESGDPAIAECMRSFSIDLRIHAKTIGDGDNPAALDQDQAWLRLVAAASRISAALKE